MVYRYEKMKHGRPLKAFGTFGFAKVRENEGSFEVTEMLTA